MNNLGLAVAIFLSSASVMVLEIAAARLLAPYVGMSTHTWTCIIATILAGMTLGHWFGGHLSETDTTKINRRLAILFSAATFSVILVPFVLRIAAPKLLVDGAPFLVSISVSDYLTNGPTRPRQVHFKAKMKSIEDLLKTLIFKANDVASHYK